MGRIEDFMATQFLGFNLEEETRVEKIYTLSDSAIAGALEEITFDDASVTPSIFLEDSENMKSLVSAFQMYGSSETAKPFKQYLVKQGLAQSVDHIDWEKIMPSIVRAPFFEDCLARGHQQYLIFN